MKLVTLFGEVVNTAPEYVPGKCNIGGRGRAIRLATGLGVIAVFLVLGIFTLSSVLLWFRLLLFVPFYVGFLAALEGTMSFCVLHASRGTYDLHEPTGMAFGQSDTKVEIIREDWRQIDGRKAKTMHLEAALGALVLALLLALA